MLDQFLKENDIRTLSNRQISEMVQVSHTKINESIAGKREYDFYVYVEMLNIFFSEKENYQLRKDAVYEFCKKTERKLNHRMALEYLDMSGELELLEYVIEKGKNSNNNLNKKFARSYDLLYLRNTGNISTIDYLKTIKKKFNGVSSIGNISQISLMFALIYGYFDYRDYKQVKKYMKELLPLIESLSNDFFRSSYLLRIQEIQITLLHRNNELDEARKLCNEILKRSDRLSLLARATAYCVLGETYMFDDYDLSKYYLKKGFHLMEFPKNRKMLKKKRMIKTTMDFVDIHYEKNLDNIKPIHSTEEAYLYVKKEMMEKAKEVIEEFRIEYGYITTNQKFILGLAENDGKILEEALLDYKNKGDLFYARLPEEVLQLKRGDVLE
ncbi:hypothetical protein CN579_22095 [Bacillus toyonensis]|nr:hypothetical protein CN579_22095 [Bacillus toyonensis]